MGAPPSCLTSFPEEVKWWLLFYRAFFTRLGFVDF